MAHLKMARGGLDRKAARAVLDRALRLYETERRTNLSDRYSGDKLSALVWDLGKELASIRADFDAALTLPPTYSWYCDRVTDCPLHAELMAEAKRTEEVEAECESWEAKATVLAKGAPAGTDCVPCCDWANEQTRRIARLGQEGDANLKRAEKAEGRLAAVERALHPCNDTATADDSTTTAWQRPGVPFTLTGYQPSSSAKPLDRSKPPDTAWMNGIDRAKVEGMGDADLS